MMNCQKLLREVYNRTHILIPESLKEDVKLALSTDSVTISKEKYEGLIESRNWLLALESAGVDNWSGCDYARELFIEMKEEKDD